ncbi:MAG: dicarboxylate/amino acid:cation symporter [Nitrospira sp.]|nr:dicarboxylate/amino acid:cation symporter [Nitrospira sp.]
MIEPAISQTAEFDDRPTPSRRRPIPLYTRVLIGALCGTALGLFFGRAPYLGPVGNEHLGLIGLGVITLLKALAIPLIFFAILDAFLRMSLPLRQGTRLLAICLVNVSVAMTIGLVIMNVWNPGTAWHGHLDQLLATDPRAAGTGSGSGGTQPGEAIEYLASYIPNTMLRPFTTNNIIGVVLLAVIAGAALRQLRTSRPRPMIEGTVVIVERVYYWLVRILGWIIEIVPFAVFGVLAQVVGKAGAGVFSLLWIFLVTILAGLAIHALFYYPTVAWLIGNKAPGTYIGKGADAIMTALSCNSSLATVPVTLRCLERMQVSPESSRLAACVGTNLNNDGITLYEAMAALFLAQALGFDLALVNQLLIIAASIVAGVGAAGIPEAGLVVLPLVLSAAGLPDQIITAAIPLIMTVDWILARVRSGVNVMSDMLVAILLDAAEQRRRSSGP